MILLTTLPVRVRFALATSALPAAYYFYFGPINQGRARR
jgi:hypothetical protein